MKSNGLFFPHDELNGNAVMIDYLEDNRRRLKRALVDMDDRALCWQPDPQGNSIAVTLLHMGRLLDVFLAQVIEDKPADGECWFQHGWADRTGYDPRGIGLEGWGTVNEYTLEEVAALPHLTTAELLGYLDEVYDRVKGFINEVSMSELSQAAPGLRGEYTKYQVLSMGLMDNVRHLGEIYTLKALRERGYSNDMP
jgi:hypothetical protein